MSGCSNDDNVRPRCVGTRQSNAKGVVAPDNLFLRHAGYSTRHRHHAQWQQLPNPCRQKTRLPGRVRLLSITRATDIFHVHGYVTGGCNCN
jgi:hypothetical protein